MKEVPGSGAERGCDWRAAAARGDECAPLFLPGALRYKPRRARCSLLSLAVPSFSFLQHTPQSQSLLLPPTLTVNRSYAEPASLRFLTTMHYTLLVIALAASALGREHGHGHRHGDYHSQSGNVRTVTSWVTQYAHPTTAATTKSPTTFATAVNTPNAIHSAKVPVKAPDNNAANSGSSNQGLSLGNLVPNGKKAGLSGFPGISNISAFGQFAEHISWYSDYLPDTPDANGVMGIGMLWAAQGSSCTDLEKQRMQLFNDYVDNGNHPSIMFGFFEPDCYCPMSSDMSTRDAANAWNQHMVPLKNKGTILGSPSMCKQYDEDFLEPFSQEGLEHQWDVTSIHVNKPNIDEVKKVVEHYTKYNKPIWVSEFACVNDQPSWSPCTDQDQINSFIYDSVRYFESHPSVVAYGPSNGMGLGDVWPLTDSNGELTTSGKTYLYAIQGL
ncbi:glycoside hydrolase family 128 protein [Piedraia hortae CBS 480.64]|uniref:Glycoside hydrolase family 128 protein n=1 Tax=Piedraia hortae CBS 480.64 TaxID=1314780 RepID=A0A6A7C491_9PEZI|nr:glycoside hydrolase family 128 protein [Piedraia hortae CBS 480.64]